MATVPFSHQSSNSIMPSVVDGKISEVLKRNRTVRLLSGLVIAAAAALFVLLFAIGIDGFFVLFETESRAQVRNSAMIAMLTLVVCSLGWAVFRRVSRIDAARQIDEQIPQLEERWTSVTDFASAIVPKSMRGSETFIRKVAQEAAELERIVQPNQIRMGKALPISLGVLGCAVGVWILTFAIDPGRTTVLIKRFMNPTAPISLTQVKSESGDIVLPRGSKLKLEAVTSGRLTPDALLTIRSEGNDDQIFNLTASTTDPAKFIHAIKDLQVPFRYRFRSGDGQSEWNQVRIAERPTIKSVSIKIVPPEYSKLPVFEQDGLPKSVKALQGSQLVLTIESSIPLQSLVLQQENQPEIPLSPMESNTYRFETSLENTIAFRPVMTSTDGLANSQPPRCEIVVFRDQAPSVEVANPTNEVALRPDDNVTISFNAKDDLGISKAELVIFDPAKEGNVELKTIPISLGEQVDRKQVSAQVDIDLKQFELKHGDQLSFAIRVYDTKQETATQQPGSTQEADAKTETASNETQDQNDKSNSSQSQTKSNEQQPNASPSDQTDQKKSDQKEESAANQIDQKADEQKSAAKKPESGKDQQQAGGGNQWQPKNSKEGKQNDKEGGGLLGKQRPDFLMSKRELDTPAGQCTSCSRRSIKIDEWAGSFASQMLEKLQIQIDPVLKELKETLKKANDTLQPLAGREIATEDWKPAESVLVRTGDGHLETSEKLVKDLVTKTTDNPYAFIGLQLQDITHLHIQPAREDLNDVTLFDKPARPDDLDSSVVHIQRAIELIEKLTREYEVVKLNQKLSETMVHIKKMNQIFLEGTFAMLKSQKPNLNPKERAFMELELTDEFLAKLQELLKKKLEIQAELAKALSQDPRLLERFMARSRLEATTLRDQLTLLHERQKSLTEELQTSLPPANQPNKKMRLKNRIPKRAEAATQIAEEAARMLDNFVVWTPLSEDVNKGQLAAFKAKGVRIVATANELTRQAEDEDAAPAIASAQKLHRQLIEWEATLPELATGDVDPKMQTHVVNRTQEAQRLITNVTGWIVKEQAMDAGDHYLSVEVDQHRIAADTNLLTRKLQVLNAQCQGISVTLADSARAFLKTMEDDLLPELEESQLKLNDNDGSGAVEHQKIAIEHFATAEEQLDEIMDGIIKHLDSQPFNAKPEITDDMKPESLDELLALLDEEAKAAEGLGIPCCRPSNLIIEKDWTNPGSNPGSGGGGGGRSGRRSMQPSAQMQQARQANQRADKLQAQLKSSLNKMTQKGDGATGRENKGVANDKPERKWNTLGSKLEDHLRQGRGNLPPEQYRKAIEQYFESLAGKAKGD